MKNNARFGTQEIESCTWTGYVATQERFEAREVRSDWGLSCAA